MRVMVCYSPGGSEPLFLQSLELPAGAVVRDALTQSDVYTRYPETVACPVGVFSKVVSLDQGLHAGDRVEIYRGLIMQPKQARRRRAAAARGAEAKCQ